MAAASTAPVTGTLTACMKHYFGLLPGQVLMDFLKELKALSPADKEDFRKGLIQNGYTVTEKEAAA